MSESKIGGDTQAGTDHLGRLRAGPDSEEAVLAALRQDLAFYQIEGRGQHFRLPTADERMTIEGFLDFAGSDAAVAFASLFDQPPAHPRTGPADAPRSTLASMREPQP